MTLTRFPPPAARPSPARLAACGKKAEAPGTGRRGFSEGARKALRRSLCSADGVHIEYHVYGSGNPAVVLVHGWSCDGNYWKEQIDALKSKYTTVVVDLAGHGASARIAPTGRWATSVKTSRRSCARSRTRR